MEPFKNIFNKEAVSQIAFFLEKSSHEFNKKSFIKDASTGLKQLELKDRVRHISHAMKVNLPGPYKKNIQIIKKSVGEEKINNFLIWPLAQYIEDEGLDDLKTSLSAMKELTKYFTSEFCIRPFLERYQDDIYQVLKNWAMDKSHHVRRLCSEGIRPNLPWGIKSHFVINNLEKGVEILELLKNDESEYVRKSVANHMNDISRIDEKLFLKTIKRWNKESKEKNMQKLIRHASRTLLKKGHPEVLKVHGYKKDLNIKIKASSLTPKKIKEGEYLNLSLNIKSNEAKSHPILVDYIIHFKKLKGHSPIIFRLKDTVIKEDLIIDKKIHFKKVTTRKHYPGKHFLEIQVNGKSYLKKEFYLNEA